MTLRPATAALILFFVATVAVFGVIAPRFATATNAENLMSGFSFVAILAMGQAFPILVRGIDLSIGAIVGVVGMVVFDLAQILHVPGYLHPSRRDRRRDAGGCRQRRPDCLSQAAAVHRHARHARRLPRLHLRDLRPPARARAHHHADHRPMDHRHRELFRHRRLAGTLQSRRLCRGFRFPFSSCWRCSQSSRPYC